VFDCGPSCQYYNVFKKSHTYRFELLLNLGLCSKFTIWRGYIANAILAGVSANVFDEWHGG